MAHLLGIDIGTTNTKIIIFSENGDIIEERAFPTPFISDEYGGCYQPQEVLNALLENFWLNFSMPYELIKRVF